LGLFSQKRPLSSTNGITAQMCDLFCISLCGLLSSH
jgi:hypothetical protein